MEEPQVHNRWQCDTCGESGEGWHSRCAGIMPDRLVIHIRKEDDGTFTVEGHLDRGWRSPDEFKFVACESFEAAFLHLQDFMSESAAVVETALERKMARSLDG